MWVKDFAKRVLLAAGLDVRFAARYDSQVMQKRVLVGIPVRTVVDAGAYHGEFTAFYRSAFPTAQVFAFEPFPESASMFQARHGKDPQVHLQAVALGEAPGVASFYVNQLAATSSLLPTDRGSAVENASWYENVQKLEVPVTTLDVFAAERKLDRIDLLKMDVQGTEPAVLAGAAALLSRGAIEVVYTEVIFQPVYKGQGCPFEVCAILNRYDYSLFGIYNLYPTRTGQMLQADALFTSPALTRRVENGPIRDRG